MPEVAGIARNKKFFASSRAGNARGSARRGARQDWTSGENHHLGATLAADSIRNFSRFMLRRIIAGFDAIPRPILFFRRPIGVIWFNLREWHNRRMGSQHRNQNLFAHGPVVTLSFIAREPPPSLFKPRSYLLGRDDLLTRHVAFFHRAGSSCCARYFVFLRARADFLAAHVDLFAQPGLPSLTGFANGKIKNIKTSDGRIGLRRFWAPCDFGVGMPKCEQLSQFAIGVHRTGLLITAEMDIEVYRATIGYEG